MLDDKTVRAEKNSVGIGAGAHNNTVTYNNLEDIQVAMRQVLAEQPGSEAKVLRDRMGVTESALAKFFETLRREQVPPEKIPETLAQIAKQHTELLSRIAALENDDPDSQTRLEPAHEAIRQGLYEQADSLLIDYDSAEAEAEAQAAQILDQRRLNRAAARALRGRASLTQLRYRDAAEHFRAASELVPVGFPDKLGEYLMEYANALQVFGDQQGNNDALKQAIGVYRQTLEPCSRDRVPLDWAATQNNLGNALQTLGKRESDTANLQAAVTAHRLALEERTRERAPLQWAMSQNNLGNALLTLGKRESDTANLQAAVTAYRLALEEYTRERAPLQWATTQNNLGNALQTLGGLESDTANLQAAVTAYRLALEEKTRERAPLDWAMSQNNLGRALHILGIRNANRGVLESAREAVENARQVYVVDAGQQQHVEYFDKQLEAIESALRDI